MPQWQQVRELCAARPLEYVTVAIFRARWQDAEDSAQTDFRTTTSNLAAIIRRAEPHGAPACVGGPHVWQCRDMQLVDYTLR